MKLTGPACAEATSGAEVASGRESAEDNAGGVRVERRVRRCLLLTNGYRNCTAWKWWTQLKAKNQSKESESDSRKFLAPGFYM